MFSTKQLFEPQGGERGGRALRNSEDGIEITYLFSFMDLVESLSLLKSCMMQHLDFLRFILTSNFNNGPLRKIL